MKFKSILLLLVVLLLTGCTFTLGTGTTTENNENINVALASPSFETKTIASKDDVTVDDLFDLHNKVEIVIDVSEEEMRKLQADANRGKKPEIYRRADKVTISLTNGNNTFTWEFENVGIRQKGNLSREDIFLGDTLNNHNHYKLSFDETFTDTEMYDEEFIEEYGDKELKDREFLGLNGLDFKWNRNDDTTCLKELYASYMYKAAGILVQNIGLSTVKMNYGENKQANFGLCFLYEQTSKSFIKRKLEEDVEYLNMASWDEEKQGTFGIEGKKYGDFYKVTYGEGEGYFSSVGGDLSKASISNNKVGIKTDIYGRTYPAYERKTNKGEEYDEALLKSIVNTINDGTYSDIEKVVDLEYFAIEEAVSFFIGNPDSFRYNYNNYMIYIRRTDGKMVIVPIDNDRSFGIGTTWEPGISFGTNKDLTPLNTIDINGNASRNELFKKTLFESTECQAIYKKAINVIKDSDWVKNETFEAYYNIISTTYKGEYRFSLDGGDENVSFETFMEYKLEAAKDLQVKTKQLGDKYPKIVPPDPTTKPIDLDLTKYYMASTFNAFGNDYTSPEDASLYYLKEGKDGWYYLEFKVLAPSFHEYFSDQEIWFQFRSNVGPEWGGDITIAANPNNDKLAILSTDGQIEYFKIGVTVGKTVIFYINPETRNWYYEIK